MKKRIFSIIIAAVFLFTFAACTKTEGPNAASSAKKSEALKTVKLGFPGSQNFMAGAAGVAQEKKYFDEELQKIGYQIEYVPFAAAGPAVNEALAGKKIDFAIYADFPGLVLKSKGIDISLLAVTDSYTTSTLLVKKDSPIQSVKDLKGKKVAFTKGTFMQKNFLEMLAMNGLQEKDIQVVNVLTTDAASALLTGNVDALVYIDTIVAPIIADKSTREIVSTRNYPDIRAQSILVGANSYIKDNPEVPTAIIRALLRARDYIKSNPEDTLKIWTKTGLNEDALKIVYGTDTSKYQSYFPVEITKNSLDMLAVTKDFLLKQGLISDDFDLEKFADRSFYEKALK